MTQLYDRGEIADVLEAINQCEPRAIGVDVVFEGLRDDSLADRRIADVASASHTTVFSYKLLDYLNDETGLPKSDVLSFTLPSGFKFIVRPSGTEPKLKAYLFAQGKDQKEAESFLDNLESVVRKYCNA